MKVAKNEERGSRGKLEDVVYTLTASLNFVAEMKAANKRQATPLPTVEPVDNSATKPKNR